MGNIYLYSILEYTFFWHFSCYYGKWLIQWPSAICCVCWVMASCCNTADLLHHVIGCQGDHMTHEQEKKVTWVLICKFQPFNLIVWEILESHVSTLYNELMIERKQINVLFIDLPNVLPSMKLPLMLKFWYCEKS